MPCRDSVPAAIATVLGITPQGKAALIDTVADALGGRRLLLVVDKPAGVLTVPGRSDSSVPLSAMVREIAEWDPVLMDGYAEDEAPDAKGKLEKRIVLRLDHRIAPVKAAVLPLSRNADLSPKARDLAAQLRKRWNVDFDDAGAIGRRYRRQDEVGTPFCVTVDFDSLEDRAVTVRERDSMQQDRLSIDLLVGYLNERL